jgi:hypothetical protein
LQSPKWFAVRTFGVGNANPCRELLSGDIVDTDDWSSSFAGVMERQSPVSERVDAALARLRLLDAAHERPSYHAFVQEHNVLRKHQFWCVLNACPQCSNFEAIVLQVIEQWQQQPPPVVPHIPPVAPGRDPAALCKGKGRTRSCRR